MNRPPIPEVLVEIIQLAERMGVSRINELPGCWEVEVGEYQIAVNGHRGERWTSDGDAVPPFSALITHKHNLAAMIVNPAGGSGVGIAEDDVIAAIRRHAT